MKRIYLDNAATTPMKRRVFKAMKPYFKKYYGNPSSVHEEGLHVYYAINEARIKMAKILNCKPNEIFFTSGASESNSWVSKVYHCSYSDAVHDSIKMANRGNRNKNNVVAMSLLNSETGMSSGSNVVMYLGVDKLSCHLDITQAIGKIHVDLGEIGCATASLSAHKFGGPKGVGMLYIREDKQKDFVPLIYGHQEGELRGGTENVPGIIGMTKALELTYRNLDKNQKRMFKIQKILRDYLDENKIRYRNSYNIFNITFESLNAQSAVLIFDKYGVSISAGSACNSHNTEPSKALIYYGYSEEDALKTIRVSLGEQNTKKEIKRFIRILNIIIDKYDKI